MSQVAVGDENRTKIQFWTVNGHRYPVASVYMQDGFMCVEIDTDSEMELNDDIVKVS